MNPSALTRLLLSGEAKRFRIEVRVNGALPAVVYVLVTDSGNAFNPAIQLNCFALDACDATATTLATLPVGPVAGQLGVRVCRDSACASVITSTTLAYQFTVVGAGTQPPLARLAGADEWSTEQGSASHAGYMAATLDPARFSLRWKWMPPNLPAGPPDVLQWSGPPVSSSQKQLAYVAANVTNGSASRLFALRESDGTLGWQVSYSTLLYPGAPAVYGERVYTTVIDGNGASAAQFAAYDATTGAAGFVAPFAADCIQGCTPGAPVVVDNVAYVNVGSQAQVGGPRPPLRAYDAQTGALLWTAATGAGGAQSAAVDANFACFYVPNSNLQAGPGFTALNKATGAVAFAVPRAPAPVGSGQVYYQGDTPVLDGSGTAFVRLNRGTTDVAIQAVQLATGQRLWEVAGGAGGALAVADGTVFYANRQLTALAAADGRQQWAVPLPPTPDNTVTDRVIATRNLLFVSTSEDVFAFDRATRALVWAFPVGGRISLSASGLLYVVAPTAVYAVNLQ